LLREAAMAFRGKNQNHDRRHSEQKCLRLTESGEVGAA
jgi:hypothetical protein